MFLPSNSLRKAEGCKERSGKGLVRERPPGAGEGAMWQRQRGDGALGRGGERGSRGAAPRGREQCGGRAVRGPSGCGGERSAVRGPWGCGDRAAAGAAPRPAMAAAAAGRRPVLGSAPLRASRRAPPPRRCGHSSGPAAPAENRSRTGLGWRRGEGRWSGTGGVKLGQGIFREGLADRWEQIAGFY